MVLSKCLSLFGLNISLSKNIFILSVIVKVALITLVYIWKLHFFLKILKHCPSVLTIVALYVILKQVNFFHTVFHYATLKS